MNMLEKGLFHKNTPSVNPQSWTNVGGVLSALAARTTCQESSVVLIFRLLARERIGSEGNGEKQATGTVQNYPELFLS